MLSFFRKKAASFAVSQKEHLWFSLALLLLNGVTYLSIFDPVIFADDWFRIRKFVFGVLPFIDWSSRRPFEEAFIKLVFDIFGLNLRVLFLLQVFLIFTCSLAVYFLAVRLFSGQKGLAFLSAVLFVVYPIDYGRMWFTRIYHWEIYLAVLAGMILLWAFGQKGRFWLWLVALVLIAPTLGAYDGQLGLVLIAGILPVLCMPKMPWSRRLILLVLPGIGLLFLYWRLIFQPAVLNIHDPYLQGFKPTLSGLFQTFLKIPSVLSEGWVKPFHSLLPDITIPKLLAILAGIMVACAVLYLSFGRDPAGSNPAQKENITQVLKAYVQPLGAGLILTVAGYIPVLAQNGPNLELSTGATRANLYAIAGASILLIALCGLVASLLMRNKALAGRVVLAAVIPLVVVGIFQQVWIQDEHREDWRAQQIFWKNLFVVVHNLKDGTTLVMVERTPAPTRPFERLSIGVEWEINNGIQVLYNNPTLQGTVYLPQFTAGGSRETRFKEDGVHGYDLALIPYDKMVIVEYSPANGVIRVVKDPEKELDLDFKVQGYDPSRFILNDPPASTPYRYLVH
jgi:hypothetical protein